jgi:adenosylcobyric acid synthase
MLGESVRDPEGIAGDRGVLPGLNILPVQTTFSPTKSVSQVTVNWGADRWTAYEIHMGVTTRIQRCDELVLVMNGEGNKPEGCRRNHVWGSYLHGLFESPAVRSELAAIAGLHNYRPARVSWRAHLQRIYDGMAEALERHLNLEEVWEYVAD